MCPKCLYYAQHWYSKRVANSGWLSFNCLLEWKDSNTRTNFIYRVPSNSLALYKLYLTLSSNNLEDRDCLLYFQVKKLQPFEFPNLPTVLPKGSQLVCGKT